MLQSLAGMARMLVQPGDVYPLIRERSPLLWPMVILLVLGLISGLMIAPHLQQLVKQQLAAQPDLPAEAAAYAEQFAFWTSLAGGALGTIVYAALTAAVLALGMLFTGGTLPYRQAFSLTLLAYGPLIIRSFVVSGMVMAGLVANVTSAVTSAAAILGPEAAGTLPYRLLDLIDPLEWWHVGLLAGGIRHLADTSSRAAWVLAVVAWFLLYGTFKLFATMPAL